jgi:hypothetical protein
MRLPPPQGRRAPNPNRTMGNILRQIGAAARAEASRRVLPCRLDDEQIDLRLRELVRRQPASKPKRKKRKRAPRGPGGRPKGPPPPTRVQLVTDPDAVLSFKEFCLLINVSVRQGRRILAEPGGPVVTHLSTRLLGITRKNLQAWLESRLEEK